MATRAVYSFTGFPGTPERHLYLHHDGYPTGAAWRFATALRHSQEASSFLASFLSTQPRAEVLSGAEQSADAEYRYQVRLLERSDTRLQVACWRRLPEGSSWQPRCGPVPLAVFIQRFLPGELP
ncbi:hypothetical protein VB734_13220 [Synechococcus sp. BA-124 BA4]|uniref:hypothetical protein n=1 Tax=unclassified Synechococcus TaxID=2626047 RepID=UPI0018CD4DCE|nr:MULTISPECIES: hypothetical protein [unclassified Synechococcus]MEA5401001.1 hypothetical protein [Synechococcus sp. BA-124 BA4]QPN56787.1 hypothetical protein I1E95_00845 [Synechococcus sp. CBW1107]CAK6696427.1 hypothetical protein BBFGKLBO_02048 [Synechococcus sp. CBW1107]